MTSIDSIFSLTLDLPPSCIQFWPENEQYAVVGTYNLEAQQQGQEEPDDRSQQRNGSLILIQVAGNNVNLIQTVATPSAILDIHFGAANQPSDLFGVATSTGSIDIYKLKNGSDQDIPTTHPKIDYIKTIQYFPEDVIVTAFSWHPTGISLGMTLTTGQVCLGKVDLSLETDSSSKIDMVVHDLEAWTLAFSPDGSCMYSGGDDSALRSVEVPVNQEYHQDFDSEPRYGSIRIMPWADKKIHGAGVTAILPFNSDSEGSLVLTGSYDDHIRLIDIPVAGRRTVLAELNLGGGVWRLKQLYTSLTAPTKDSSQGIILLASCMHAGARILKLYKDEQKQWQFEVLAKFEEHKSMNYGSDCQSSLEPGSQRTFITTSFYDRLLCLWRY